MNTKPHHIVVTVVGLLFLASLALAQQAKKEPPKLFTDSKTIVGSLQISKTESLPVTGTATYQITACNADDTLAGIWTYAFTDKERERIAKLVKTTPGELPDKITSKDVVANYAKGTACPVLKLEFPAMEAALKGNTLRFNRSWLNLRETEEPLTKYFCTIARFTGTGFPKRGPCRRINEILNGEEPQ